METAELKEKLEGLVHQLLAKEPAYFLVDIKIKPVNNFKVFIDGDQGITIDTCVTFNKKLVKLMEEAHFPGQGDFSLELSSPGINEPLKWHRQYKKNIGRQVMVTTKEGKAIVGKLVNVQDAAIDVMVITGKGKKQKSENLEIPFDHINKTIIQVQF